MATRSTISLKLSEVDSFGNHFKTIYCHYDGYPSHNGAILLEHYNTLEKVEALLELGDLSILAPNLSTDEPHDFDNSVEGVCVAYGRDRGESDVEATKSFSLYYMQKEEYNYIFDNGEWFVFKDDNYKKLSKLSDVI